MKNSIQDKVGTESTLGSTNAFTPQAINGLSLEQQSDFLLFRKHFSNIKTLSILGYFSLLLWVPMFFASLMAFDAPGSDRRLAVWAFVVFVWALPIAVLIAPRYAKRALDNGRIKIAYSLVSIPPGIMLTPLIFGIFQLIYALIRF